jgi:hypothetical protein
MVRNAAAIESQAKRVSEDRFVLSGFGDFMDAILLQKTYFGICIYIQD